MNELKKGDFCGIYTRETGEPLFYTGIFDRMTDEDGRPCVFLATDPDNKNTFYRWTQSDLLKRGYYISKTGKNTIPRTAARLHIIFTHSGSLDGVRAIVEKDIYNRWIATTETGEQYMLFADHVRIAAYCIILKTETAEEIESSGMHPYQITYIRKSLEAIMAPEESTPATEATQDTTTGAQDGPTAPENNTAGENTTGADKAPEEATQRRRQAFIVECRSPRGDWKRYSDEQPTHEAAEKIKEEAENRHALTPDGAPIFYRIVQIDKGPEQIMTPQEGPTTAGTTAANETPTTAETAPQEATSDAGPAADHTGTPAAETATEGPETSTPAQDTTGTDTRPPQAAERASAANYMTTGTTTPPQNPGHACENAPGRTERAQAEQVHTAHTKSPPRGKTQGRHTTTGSRGHLGKSYFFRPDAKNESDHRKILGYPTFERLVSVNIVKKFSGPYRAIPPGVSKINTFPGAKKFFQKL